MHRDKVHEAPQRPGTQINIVVRRFRMTAILIARLGYNDHF